MNDIQFKAGPVRALWQPQDTFLRLIRIGDVEVLRGIYIALRDENWGTIPPIIEDYRCWQGEESTKIEFGLRWKTETVDFRSKVRLHGQSDGSITYSFEGQAFSRFKKNRIGFLVLHGPTAAGSEVELETVDGQRSVEKFPDNISPDQPFLNVRSLTHAVIPGLKARVEMEGDTFETEDQRNWTDASFKTYSTPLSLPFPVEINPGDQVKQSIRVTPIRGTGLAIPSSASTSVLVKKVVQGPLYSIPKIGLELPVGHERQSLSDNERAVLRRLNLDHLRLSVFLSDANVRDQLRSADSQASDLGCSLEVALYLAGGNEETSLMNFTQAASELLRQPVTRWLVFHEKEKTTRPQWVRLVRKTFGKAGIAGAVGGGTDHFFAELNRDQGAVEACDFVTFSINPQVHAIDDLSLIETLAMQAQCVKSARSFAGNRPVIVSPVTFKMRSNPNATAPEPRAKPGTMPRRADVRQATAIGAVWTLGCLRYLSEAEAASVTLFETVGCLGVMERDQGSPYPQQFPSQPGKSFPLYDAVSFFTQFKGGKIRPWFTEDPLRAIGFELIASDQSKRSEVVANLTQSTLLVDTGDGKLTLGPYSFVTIK